MKTNFVFYFLNCFWRLYNPVSGSVDKVLKVFANHAHHLASQVFVFQFKTFQSDLSPSTLRPSDLVLCVGWSCPATCLWRLIDVPPLQGRLGGNKQHLDTGRHKCHSSNIPGDTWQSLFTAFYIDILTSDTETRKNFNFNLYQFRSDNTLDHTTSGTSWSWHLSSVQCMVPAWGWSPLLPHFWWKINWSSC